MVSGILSDLRASLRALRRGRGFAGIAIGTLGVGLALCLAAFTIANAYVLRALPYPDADRLYSVRYAQPGQDLPEGLERLDWASLADVIDQAIAWDLDMFYVLGGSAPSPTPGAWITPGFVQGFGIHAAFGRGFTPEDFDQGRPQVALISHPLWQRQFHGDPAIIGRQFQAYVSDRPDEAETFTIVGVLPPEFWHVNIYTDVLVPLRGERTYPYVVRLRQGVTPAIAAQRISAMVRAGAQPPRPGGWPGGSPEGWQATLVPAQAAYTAQIRPVLLAIGGAAVLVLLIACVNVAALLLVRASRREKELAVRLALGASRARLARLLLVEGVLLGGAATACGVIVSRLVLYALAPAIERQLGRTVPGGPSGLDLDPITLLAASAAGLITTCTFMLMPLAASWRTRATLALHFGARGASDGPARQRVRAFLIALEIAGSLALLASAALMIDSARRMLHVDFGLRADHIITGNFGMRQRSYPDAARRAAFYERLVPQFEAVAGAGRVAFSNQWAMQSPMMQPIEHDGVRGRAGVIGVSANYFAVLGIPLRDGRSFNTRDTLTSEPVAIVSETLARQFSAHAPPNASIVGQRIALPIDPDSEAAPADASGPPREPRFRPHLVIGIVGDVRQSHTDDDRADVYVPFFQRPNRFGTFFVQAPGAAARAESRLRDALARVDSQVSMGPVRPLQDQIDQQRARPRFLASLLSAFAGLAGLLVLVGIHGTIAYAVRQREREIAVRMAVGAERGSVIRLFLRQGAWMLGAGLILGLAAARATGRLIETQLFGVRANDPALLALTAVSFAICGLLAIWWPARRAATIDPVIALRDE